MRHLLRLAAISTVLGAALNPGIATVKADDVPAAGSPAPKSEDAEKNAFQTPTTGQRNSPERSRQTKSDANPESRLNDDPPAQEKIGTSKDPHQ